MALIEAIKLLTFLVVLPWYFWLAWRAELKDQRMKAWQKRAVQRIYRRRDYLLIRARLPQQQKTTWE